MEYVCFYFHMWGRKLFHLSRYIMFPVPRPTTCRFVTMLQIFRFARSAGYYTRKLLCCILLWMPYATFCTPRWLNFSQCCRTCHVQCACIFRKCRKPKAVIEHHHIEIRDVHLSEAAIDLLDADRTIIVLRPCRGDLQSDVQSYLDHIA